MKTSLLIISFFITIISFAQQPFAKIYKDVFVIEKDTVAFKKFLKDNLFSESKTEIRFDKVEIKKQKILTSDEEYFYVVISDSKNHIRVAKWLNKIGDNLYSKDVIDDDDLFENIYQTCVGKQDCNMNVFVLDSKRYWTCGETMTCLTDEQAKLIDCKAYKSIIPID